MNEEDSSYKRRLRKFEEENGSECYRDPGDADDDNDPGGDTYYYRNGAWREGGANGVMAPAIQPVSVETEYNLAQNILKFYEFRLKTRVQAFNKLRNYLDHLDTDDPEPHLEKLKELQRLVEEAKPGVVRARRVLAQTRRGQAIVNQREGEETRKERFNRWRGKVRAIRI